MEFIDVTFPKGIKPESIIYILEEGIKQNPYNEGSSIKVNHIGGDIENNDFRINSESAKGFYLAGITAAAILEAAGQRN